jgi:hypothetical protein
VNPVANAKLKEGTIDLKDRESGRRYAIKDLQIRLTGWVTISLIITLIIILVIPWVISNEKIEIIKTISPLIALSIGYLIGRGNE